MKRVLFVMLAAAMFVACNKDTGAAEKQMTEYKAQWGEMTSLLDVEAIEAEGFDAWYNTLTNSEVRDLYVAVDDFSQSYEEAEHWYKNLSDDEQKAVRAVAEAWEVENAALQMQVELFAEELLGVEFDADNQEECSMPLLKFYYPEVVEEDAAEASEQTQDREVVEPVDSVKVE